MNIKQELVKTLKNLMGVYFEKVYTKDELKVSERIIGGKVELINSDGSLIPVEDGDYVMDDDFSFSVKDGLIVSIVGEEPIVEDAPVEEEIKAEEEPIVEEPIVEEPKEDLSAKIDELSKKYDDLLSMIESLASEKMESAKAVESFEKEVKNLNETIKTLAKVPVEFSKTNQSNIVKESKEEKLISISSIGYYKNK